MTREEIIDGLKFTVDMFLFDPSTGETFTEPRNDMDKTTIDACRGAIELLEQTDGDLISREIEKADFLMAKVKDFERTAIRVKHNTEIIDRLIDYIHGVIVNAEKDHFVIDEERKYALREKFNLPSAEKTANKININEYVKVKLTDYGKEIFYHQYDNINKTYGKEIIKPSYPTVDSDGYTSFQLWYFMNLYGRHIDMGVQNVIEPLEIVFESAEKTAEWISVRKQKPEGYEEVIATVKYDYKDKQEYEVVTGVRYSKEDGWEWAYEAGADYYVSLDEEVVAWQPLPNPYEVKR